MIKCKNISLKFGDKNIFEDFSFEVNSSEFVTLKGESGKGKSSLLKILQGYVSFINGSIEINGDILEQSTISKIRNSIIWIPQNVNLPVQNGMQLVDLLGLKDNINIIESLLNQLDIDIKMLSDDFQKISGGQKQRIIIAICLSIEKPIVLMDEPTSSLDEASIQLLLKTVKGLKNKTILSASHNNTWIKSSNRVIELK